MRPTSTIRTALLLMLISIAAHAAEIGETVQARMTLGDRQFPLPRGEWVVAGLGTQELPHGADGAFGVIRTAVLLQSNHGRVTAIAEFNTNEIPLTGGWDTSAACDHPRPELRLVRYRSRLDSACAFVTDSPMTGGPPAWEQARDFIANHHLDLTDTMLTAAFVVSDAQDLIDARLHFDPAGFPAHEEAQRLLFAWATRFAPEFEAGLANQLSDQPSDGPLRTSLLSDTPALDQRLLALEKLHQSGAITSADALLQEQSAQADLPRSADPPSSDTWYSRLSTPVINFVTAYSVTQSAPIAIAITLTEHVAHQAVSVANEATWDHAVAQATRHSVRMPTMLHIGEAERRGPTS